MEPLVIITPGELTAMIREAVSDALKATQPEKLYTRTQLCKLLNRSSRTINRLIETGQLIATSDGRVSHTNLENYLKNN